MAAEGKKTLARSFGQFLGHIVRAVKSDPAQEKKEIRRSVDEEEQDEMILRRTTIDEIEIKKSDQATKRPSD